MCVCVCVWVGGWVGGCVCVCMCVCVCVDKPVAVELRCHATALIIAVKNCSILHRHVIIMKRY